MAKKVQLVCQHLENISGDVLEDYQDIIREYVSRCQGVYAQRRTTHRKNGGSALIEVGLQVSELVPFWIDGSHGQRFPWAFRTHDTPGAIARNPFQLGVDHNLRNPRSELH